MTGYAQAEQAGTVLLTQWVREGKSDTEIAAKLRVARWRLADQLAEIRRELRDIGAPGGGRHTAGRGRQSSRLAS